MRMTSNCIVLVFVTLLGTLPASLFGEESKPQASLNVEHRIAAIESGRFHGWPANNGVWQWGNDILVGYTQGDFEVKDGHNISGRQDSLLSFSDDGGETWEMIDPENFLDDENKLFLGKGKTKLTEPIDFTHPGFALRIFATGYHGNDDPTGGFFYSYDKGRTWNGPYEFTGLVEHSELKGNQLNPRTDYLVQNGNHVLIVISAREGSRGKARMGVIESTDGGLTFDFVAWITPEDPDFNAIMSQTVQLSDKEFVFSYRKIYRDSDKLSTVETYKSTDGCQTWNVLSTVKVMPTHSNPPALVALQDGRLCCIYGDRQVGEIRGRYSSDQGETWGPEFIIRDDFMALESDPDSQGRINTDCGYPRMVQRPDGKLVAMYYWATAEHPEQHIAVSIWTP
ncbi:BNR/Asp-box repeat protein [Polystyrenella longa]|uniref:BNR/Asp-box repeat protein n=1 Tax=Polystyrenella longa TaxID=2528007 RepID=A0A518CNZ2_9PLAN|nr:sialidase family protein [Polystyrenella longa]QDU80942.1 BNR/Asp-box repeat protein [Polystyrenella longa]